MIGGLTANCEGTLGRRPVVRADFDSRELDAVAWRLHSLAAGNHRLACPSCAQTKKRQRDTALSVQLRADGFCHLNCFRCGKRGWIHPRTGCRKKHPPPTNYRARPQFVEREEPGRSDTHADARALWQSTRPLSELSVAVRYLDERCCAIPPDDGDLRVHPELPHPSGWTGPALVALVTDAIDLRPLTLHRTWLARDGSGKAAFASPRLLFPRLTKRNGVVRLWPDDEITYGLALAEGVETALSLAQAFGHAWACLDAGNLGAMPVLAGIESITVAVDNDPAGRRAFEQLLQRWQPAGLQVRRIQASVRGDDFNDIACGLR